MRSSTMKLSRRPRLAIGQKATLFDLRICPEPDPFCTVTACREKQSSSKLILILLKPRHNYRCSMSQRHSPTSVETHARGAVF